MKLTGHVGFDSLPDQLVNKSVNKGFSFNVLCIGMCVSFLFTQFNSHNCCLKCLLL